MDQNLHDHLREAFDLGAQAAAADREALEAQDPEACRKARRLHEMAAAAWGRFLKLVRHA